MKNQNEALSVTEAILELSHFEWAIIDAARQIEEFREKDVDITSIKKLAQDLQAVVNHPFVTRNREMMEVINSLGN